MATNGLSYSRNLLVMGKEILLYVSSTAIVFLCVRGVGWWVKLHFQSMQFSPLLGLIITFVL